jgi:hypothetical protein
VKRSALHKLGIAAICAAESLGVPLAVGAEGTGGPPAEADVMLPDCPAVALGARALLAALELELRHDGVRRINPVPAQRTDDVTTIEVRLDCEPGANQVLLRVRNAPYQEAQRAMDITDLPRWLRARAVALAAAELARSTWSNSPPLAQVEAASPPHADAGNSTQSSRTSSATSRPPPPPARPAAEPPAAKLPDRLAVPSPSGRLKRRWLGLAVGPEARWLAPATVPLFGARVAVRIGRWQVGADALFLHDSRFTAATVLGLTVGWAAFEAFARERGSWRFSTGPRLAAGAGWSRVPVNGQGTPEGSPLPATPDGQSAAAEETTRGLYLEGSLAAGIQARTAAGWLFALDLDAGLGWGIAPGKDSPQPSIRPSVGIGLLAGRDF